MTPTVRFKKLHPQAVLPQYQTDGAAGMDLEWFTDVGAYYKLDPGEVARFETGLAIEIPVGFEGQLRARSSTAYKGLIIPNAPGTIDADFRGEIQFMLMNATLDPIKVESNVRLVQLVIAPVSRATIQEVDELTPTARGAGGCGSTGR